MNGNDYVFSLKSQDNYNRNNYLELYETDDEDGENPFGRRPRAQQTKPMDSLSPGTALVNVLTDGIDTEAWRHAEAIVDSYKPAPWKGQIWRKQDGYERVWTGPVYEDLVWTGTDWEPIQQIQVAEAPVTLAEPSTVSVSLTEAYRVLGGYAPATVITPAELNAAYERFETEPDSEGDTLWVSIAAFIRSPQRLAQCRNMFRDNPETATEIDDLFMDFLVDLRQRMPTQYRHEGKLDRWINVLWSKYFYRGTKQEMIQYLSETSFIDHTHPADYWCNDESPRERLIRELDTAQSDGTKPANPLHLLSPADRSMLSCALRGETGKQAAKRLNITPRHAGRLLAAAIARARRILNEDDPEPGVVCLSACAAQYAGRTEPEYRLAESRTRFLTPQEAAQYLGGLNPRTVVRWAREEYIPSFPIGEGKRRIWRFLQGDLETWMLGRRQGGQNVL